MTSDKTPERDLVNEDLHAIEVPANVDRHTFLMRSAVIPANRRLDFDTTVTAMALTAKEMNAKCKETSEGGLAVSVTLC